MASKGTSREDQQWPNEVEKDSLGSVGPLVGI